MTMRQNAGLKGTTIDPIFNNNIGDTFTVQRTPKEIHKITMGRFYTPSYARVNRKVDSFTVHLIP
jgi:hypothetical protein